jgi:hypothetical protein
MGFDEWAMYEDDTGKEEIFFGFKWVALRRAVRSGE